MNWKIAEAKQRFSAVIKAAQDEPQLIANRNQLVAAVIAFGTFEEYRGVLERRQKKSLAETFKGLRQLCESESYSLEVAAREDRVNPMVEALDDVSQ